MEIIKRLLTEEMKKFLGKYVVVSAEFAGGYKLSCDDKRCYFGDTIPEVVKAVEEDMVARTAIYGSTEQALGRIDRSHGKRFKELVDRLVAPGCTDGRFSASEMHELHDYITSGWVY